MAAAKCSDADFIALNRRLQSPTEVAKELGQTLRAVQQRRARMEASYGIVLPCTKHGAKAYHKPLIETQHGIAKFPIENGVILVGSDAHIWPGPLSTMQRAFLYFCETMKPAAVVANGDFFDGARNSRWPSIGWEQKPKVHQELQAVQDYMREVKAAAPKAKRFWPLGNHDARFENKLAAQVSEYENIKGMHLKDHFDDDWLPCWRVDVNDDVVIRHRENGGEHADWNNVVKGGKTIVTGHDHRTGVVPYHDYSGVRYGVRCGFMGDSPNDPQYVNYLEAREPNWHPAFVVLTFIEGVLLYPELVTKHNEQSVQFRGDLIGV